MRRALRASASALSPSGAEPAEQGDAAAASTDLLWVGSRDGVERELVENAGLNFASIETGQLRGQNPLTALRNAVKMVVGLRQSLTILRDFRPDVCFVTGGYVCAPAVAACRLRGVPVLIYLPDMKPGWAIRALSMLAQRVAISFPAAAGYFGGLAPEGKAVVTGYPVRAELVVVAGNKAAARRQLAMRLGKPILSPDFANSNAAVDAAVDNNQAQSIDEDEPLTRPAAPAAIGAAGRLPVSPATVAPSLPQSTDESSVSQTERQQAAGATQDDAILPLVLIWGGSSGARSINRATWAMLHRVLPHAHVLHIVGARDWPLHEEAVAEPALAATLDGPNGAHYHPVPYLHDEMALALAAADVSIARAGASTLGEFPVAGLPSILVPLLAVNQQENAETLAEHGGAVVVADDQLSEQLAPALLALLANEKRLTAMREQLAALAEPHAARNIADELRKLGDNGKR